MGLRVGVWHFEGVARGLVARVESGKSGSLCSSVVR